MNKASYWYSVGKIRALEKRLLGRTLFQQAAEGGRQDALKLFAEAMPEGDELLQVKESSGVEKFLAGERENLERLIRQLLPDRNIVLLLEPASLLRLDILLRNVKPGLIADYFRHAADLYNIAVFFRMRACAMPEQELPPELAAGGFLDKKDFRRLYSKETAAFLHLLSNVHKHGRIVDYALALEDGISSLESGRSFILLERRIKDFLIGVLRPAKYISCGPEPLVAYYYARLNEIELIRLVLLGKFYGFDAAAMKERINAVYA